jgi:hypothetical protein
VTEEVRVACALPVAVGVALVVAVALTVAVGAAPEALADTQEVAEAEGGTAVPVMGLAVWAVLCEAELHALSEREAEGEGLKESMLTRDETVTLRVTEGEAEALLLRVRDTETVPLTVTEEEKLPEAEEALEGEAVLAALGTACCVMEPVAAPLRDSVAVALALALLAALRL